MKGHDNLKNGASGYLVELLIIVVIIGILLATAFPTYAGLMNLVHARSVEASAKALVPEIQGYLHAIMDGEPYLYRINGIEHCMEQDGALGGRTCKVTYNMSASKLYNRDACSVIEVIEQMYKDSNVENPYDSSAYMFVADASGSLTPQPGSVYLLCSSNKKDIVVKAYTKDTSKPVFSEVVSAR
ncbi:MAG: hypothetical protein HQL06_13865 [Nitrospirae bacterium]|nr:hypothetical protein [Nitrospirota bacterium]